MLLLEQNNPLLSTFPLLTEPCGDEGGGNGALEVAGENMAPF